MKLKDINLLRKIKSKMMKNIINKMMNLEILKIVQKIYTIRKKILIQNNIINIDN